MIKPITRAAAAARSLVDRFNKSRLARRVSRFVFQMAWLLGFAAVLLSCQVAMFLALLNGAVELGAYVTMHFLGCFALAACLVWRLKGSLTADRYATALQIVAWSAIAGPFGAFVASALSFSSPMRAVAARDRDATGRAADCSEVELAERMQVALLDGRVRIEGASLIVPLTDVIAEGSQADKLEALGVIYRRYEVRLSGMLKRALRDSNASVRVFAATVIAKLHATYSGRIGNCQIAAIASPGLAQNWRNLAEARLAYADSGLLEAPQARAQVEVAAGDFSRAAELDPAGQASDGRLDIVQRQTVC